MAKVVLNPWLNWLSGAVEGFVYRRYRGKTILQRKPTFTQPRSPGQKATESTFAGGSEFAKRVKADPTLLELYRARGRPLQLNYRQMAIRDFFGKPRINGVQVENYTPPAGGRLIISASDDFEVVRVTVQVKDELGKLLAEGDATGPGFLYFNLPPITPEVQRPVRATITAYDRPGNATTREFVLSLPGTGA